MENSLQTDGASFKYFNSATFYFVNIVLFLRMTSGTYSWFWTDHMPSKMPLYFRYGELNFFECDHQFLTFQDVKSCSLLTVNYFLFRDMGLDIFRVNIINNQTIKYKSLNGLLSLIEKERNGEIVDRQLIKSLLRMLSDLQVGLPHVIICALKNDFHQVAHSNLINSSGST